MRSQNSPQLCNPQQAHILSGRPFLKVSTAEFLADHLAQREEQHILEIREALDNVTLAEMAQAIPSAFLLPQERPLGSLRA